MKIKVRVEMLERIFGTGVPKDTDKIPLEVFRRIVDGRNSQAEWQRWGPLVLKMAKVARAAIEEADLDPRITSDIS